MEKILVAEDSPEIAKLMELTLRIEGYEIFQAFDGVQALELARLHRPDLILLDVMMPGLNGFEVAQELKKDDETAGIPIIFVTAKHELDTLVQGLEVAVDYISKPFAVPELAARVRAAMRSHKLQRDLRDSNKELFEELSRLAHQNEDTKDTDAVSDENTLIRGFNFPDEVRSSCEQYLLYFVEFLKNVGMEASAHLEHEAGPSGKVLFSVTPAGGRDALQKVRRALDIYLELAQRPSAAPDSSAPIEVLKLEAQILHLQSQWRFAEATIQAKNAAIESKDFLIAQLREGTVFQHAQQDSPKKNDLPKVELLGGILKLKTYDAGLVEIDLPRLVDHLPRFYKNLPLLFDYLRHFMRHEESTETNGDTITILPLPPAERPALPVAPEDTDGQ